MSNNIVKSFKQAMDSFDIAINNLTGEYLYKPQIIYGVLVLFLVLYSAQIAPVLPSSVSNVFNTSFFKLFVFIIILWVAHVSPSLSILIAVVFLLSTNYFNTKKLWESLDNTTTLSSTPTPVDSVNAINNLTVQAMTPSAASTSAVNNAVNTAMSNVSPSDPASITAIQSLGQQAMSPTAGELSVVQNAMTTAVAGVNNNLSQTVTPSSAIQAIQLLANNAITPAPIANTVVMTAANTAINAIPITANSAISAVQELAQQAVTAAPKISKGDITTMTKKAIQAITSAPINSPVSVASLATITPLPLLSQIPVVNPTQQDSGCYPSRHIDMSKVNASTDNHSIEDYQPFISSTQTTQGPVSQSTFKPMIHLTGVPKKSWKHQ